MARAGAAGLEAGRAALAAGRWSDARSTFERVLAGGEDPDALEGAADALWWLGEGSDSLRYRERAWLAHRAARDAVRAGAAALDLCIGNLVSAGNAPAGLGWLSRAERVTRHLDPNPLQGWLWLLQGFVASEPDAAQDLIRRAVEFAQRDGDADLELLAVSDLGLALVSGGDVDAGLALLDEAVAAALAGERGRLDTVVFVICNMLAACHQLGDLDRATRWCAAAEEFQRTYGSPFLYARCRLHYGGVLVARGRWQQAEDQLQAALELSPEQAGPGPRVEALGQLADLRLRQGRIEEAEALLALVDDPDVVPLAAAALRLARGEAPIAAGLLRRRSRQLPDSHIECAPTLALLVEAAVAEGDLRAATEAVDRLRTVAAQQGRGSAHAMAGRASALLASAEGRPDDAVAHLETALGSLADLDLPLEAARCRHELARLLADEHADLAVDEARRALVAFQRLGAGADATAASRLLRSLGSPAPAGPRTPGPLTQREQDVLRLVALGLSNPEIAERLAISTKTASHHVSRVLTKLGLRNRTEAAAYAARHTATPPKPGAATRPYAE